MTAGGIWAMVPDLPRLFREDFYWEPISSWLGQHDLERWLHKWGDLFFFHRSLDAQPHEYALHGLILMLLFYNMSIFLLMKLEHKSRNSLANRAWRAHRSRPARDARRRIARLTHSTADKPPDTHTAPIPPNDTDHDVIYRIGPGSATGTDSDS